MNVIKNYVAQLAHERELRRRARALQSEMDVMRAEVERADAAEQFAALLDRLTNNTKRVTPVIELPYVEIVPPLKKINGVDR